MSQMNVTQVSGLQKAAALLLSVGIDYSSAVLQFLNEDELERVLLACSEANPIPARVREEVLKETCELAALGGGEIKTGGLEFARQLLTRLVGPRRGAEILERISAVQKLSSFEIVRNADPAQVASLLQEEHPQTIAVVLSYLDAKLAADILSKMPPEIQTDVTLRLAQMDNITPQVVKVVEEGLKQKLATVFSEAAFMATGGVDFLVKVLNQIDRDVQNKIFDELEASNPNLAEEIRANLFTFDDLAKLDDKAVQRVLQDVNKQDLVLALKGAPETIRELIYRNLSERARENLKEELEILGPQLAKNVYEAQRRIVEVVRDLEQREEIIIAGSGVGNEIIY